MREENPNPKGYEGRNRHEPIQSQVQPRSGSQGTGDRLQINSSCSLRKHAPLTHQRDDLNRDSHQKKQREYFCESAEVAKRLISLSPDFVLVLHALQSLCSTHAGAIVATTKDCNGQMRERAYES